MKSRRSFCLTTETAALRFSGIPPTTHPQAPRASSTRCCRRSQRAAAACADWTSKATASVRGAAAAGKIAREGSTHAHTSARASRCRTRVTPLLSASPSLSSHHTPTRSSPSFLFSSSLSPGSRPTTAGGGRSGMCKHVAAAFAGSPYLEWANLGDCGIQARSCRHLAREKLGKAPVLPGFFLRVTKCPALGTPFFETPLTPPPLRSHSRALAASTDALLRHPYPPRIRRATQQTGRGLPPPRSRPAESRRRPFLRRRHRPTLPPAHAAAGRQPHPRGGRRAPGVGAQRGGVPGTGAGSDGQRGARVRRGGGAGRGAERGAFRREGGPSLP